ncbi:MAG: hypothetical protein GWO16_06230, partial [Gammaproteobacteria bacterium]|nr:hypothetical protein [Gammaproteobacteria bacterium]NIR97638.1 hypothetical protein [Gammaproteobacteria bacterium]NIT63288.1 hypothetical protein [Gammaproteobacteria bacterium]NIV20217.1 hypothetical protein [Gammaproteobacteria bacterium]NIY31868.1 hypothetical protein [Gammaproteobacteria bacterium]
AAGLGGPAGRYIAAGALAALAPAVVTALALERNALAALNPANVLGYVSQMGPAYLGALAASLGTVGLAALAWRAGLGAFSALAVSLYLALVVMHLLGRAAFHRRA